MEPGKEIRTITDNGYTVTFCPPTREQFQRAAPEIMRILRTIYFDSVARNDARGSNETGEIECAAGD